MFGPGIESFCVNFRSIDPSLFVLYVMRLHSRCLCSLCLKKKTSSLFHTYVFHQHIILTTRAQVRIDVKFPYILHSCGDDGQVLSYDLRKERRVKSQFQKRKSYNAMSQRKDNENKLLVVTKCGKIQAWDRDYDNPVMNIEDTQNSLNCVSLSSSGRFLAVAGDDGLVKIYEFGQTSESPVLIAIGDGHFTRVVDISWAPDEKQLVSVADNCSMCTWNFF